VPCTFMPRVREKKSEPPAKSPCTCPPVIVVRPAPSAPICRDRRRRQPTRYRVDDLDRRAGRAVQIDVDAISGAAVQDRVADVQVDGVAQSAGALGAEGDAGADPRALEIVDERVDECAPAKQSDRIDMAGC